MAKQKIKDNNRYSQEEADKSLKKLELELKEEFKQKSGGKKINNNRFKKEDTKKHFNHKAGKPNTFKPAKERKPLLTGDQLREEFTKYINDTVLSIIKEFNGDETTYDIVNKDESVITTKVQMETTKNRQQYAVITSKCEKRTNVLYIYNIVNDGRKGANATILVVNGVTANILFSRFSAESIKEADKYLKDIFKGNISRLIKKEEAVNEENIEK